jgi:hypothetical protein
MLLLAKRKFLFIIIQVAFHESGATKDVQK